MKNKAPKPRLLVLTSTYPLGKNDATPVFVHELASRLTDQYRVIVLAPHARGLKKREYLDGVLVLRFRYAPSALETLCYGSGIMANLKNRPYLFFILPFFLLGLGIHLLALLPKMDKVHAHWLIPQGVLVALVKVLLAKPPPLLCTIHGGDWYAAPFLAPLKRWVINQSQTVAVVSSALQKEIPKAIVAPMGIDCKNRFLPGTAARDLSELLFVGRLVPKKGLLMLIDALALVLKKQPAMHLTIVGDGPEKEKAQKRACELGIIKQVHFLGALPNAALPFYYQRAGLFIAPSVVAANGDSEGLGLVVAESLACLCPVVVSSTKAFQDLVIPNENGLVFTMGNALDLAEKILWACNHPEAMQKMAQKGYAKVLENFSWEKVSTHYGNILRTL